MLGGEEYMQLNPLDSTLTSMQIINYMIINGLVYGV